MRDPAPFSVNLPCKRVLCVEPDPVLQRILLGALAEHGCTVACVGSETEALAEFGERGAAFDGLVTSHCDTHLRGPALVARLRSRGYTGPVVVLCEETAPSPLNYGEPAPLFLARQPLDFRTLRSALGRPRTAPPLQAIPHAVDRESCHATRPDPTADT